MYSSCMMVEILLQQERVEIITVFVHSPPPDSPPVREPASQCASCASEQVKRKTTKVPSRLRTWLAFEGTDISFGLQIASSYYFK